MEFPFHKIILSAASKYCYNYFKQISNQGDNKKELPLPELVTSEFSKGNPKDSLNIAIKYCYANQDYASITNEITENNAFTVWSYAYCWNIKSLIENLERVINNSLLNEKNAMKMMNDAILFELPKLKEGCIGWIKRNFGKLKNEGGWSIDSIANFNYETFKMFISADDIEVEDEKEVCELVLGYINSRKNLQPPKEEITKVVEVVEPKKEEVVEPPKEEEKKDGEEGTPKEGEEEPPKEEEKKEGEEEPPKEEEKKEGEEEPPKEEEKKIETIPEENEQATEPREPLKDLLGEWKEHINKIQSTLKIMPLTPEQERELILCIRFSFWSHNDWIHYSTDPILSVHKDLLLEGLSVRLNTYESAREKPWTINLTPRTYTKPLTLSLLPNQNQMNQMGKNSDNINNISQDEMYSSNKYVNQQIPYNNSNNIANSTYNNNRYDTNNK
ncbi:MAG: BTB/POZ domain-containing protein, partial [Mycoplasma sp.]